MQTEDVMKIAASTALGAAQPYILKKVLLPANDQVLIQGIGNFGKMSSLATLATGVTAIALALYGIKSRKAPAILDRGDTQMCLVSYGAAALTAEIIQDYLVDAAPSGTAQRVTAAGPVQIGSMTGARAQSYGRPMNAVSFGNASPMQGEFYPPRTAEGGLY